MTFQTSTAVENAALDAREAAAGTSPILKIRTGPPPASCAAADTGTALIPINLPADWMANASGRTKVMSGTWSGTAIAQGRGGHYRIYDNTGVTCNFQGIFAGPWKGSTNYAVGDTITNDSGKVFRATTPGVSAATGGPTGTGTGITDGAAVWSYVQAVAEMTGTNGDFAIGDAFSVTSNTWTGGNA